jgi:hypothetical protein
MPLPGGRLDVAAAFLTAAGAAFFGAAGWAFFAGADFFGAGEDDFFDGKATTSGRAAAMVYTAATLLRWVMSARVGARYVMGALARIRPSSAGKDRLGAGSDAEGQWAVVVVGLTDVVVALLAVVDVALLAVEDVDPEAWSFAHVMGPTTPS